MQNYPPTGDCNDEDFQQACVDYHEITELEFDEMSTYYFGTAPNAFKSITANDLLALADYDCDSNYVKVSYPTLHSNNNNNIMLSHQAGSPLPHEIAFSIPLIKGILRIYEPDTVEFSKSIEDNHKLSVVLRVIRNNVVVYCANRNHQTP